MRFCVTIFLQKKWDTKTLFGNLSNKLVYFYVYFLI